jgi:lipopolysaccharide/colanic/teichoic acid biosynthesis glycosyltransferase
VNAPPGLSGYWQVNGKNKTTFKEMIEMDIFYTRNMSIWLDLKVIFKTMPALIEQMFESRGRRGGDEFRRVARIAPRTQRLNRAVKQR